MIHPKYAQIVFGIMSLIVSGIATFRAQGVIDNFFTSWMPAWGLSWAIAFPTIVTISPIVRRLVSRLTKTV